MTLRRTRPIPPPSAAALLLALTAALLFAAVPAAFAKQSLGISSASFKFEAKPGQVGKGEVYLTNEGDQPIKVMVYASDQKVDASGKPSYVTPSRDTPNFLASPASWVRVQLPGSAKAVGNTPYIELKPKERLPVKFLVEVPAGAVAGDKQIMLFFEMFDFQTISQGGASRVSGRIGARITARIAGQMAELVEVRPFTVPQWVLGDAADYSFTLLNEGNVDKKITSSLVLMDRNDSERQRTSVMKDDTVYAGTSVQKSGQLKVGSLFPGRYTVRLETTFAREGNAPAERILKDRQLWVIPLWLVVTVAVLLVLMFVAVIWRLGAGAGRRRSERQRAAVEKSGKASPDKVA